MDGCEKNMDVPSKETDVSNAMGELQDTIVMLSTVITEIRARLDVVSREESPMKNSDDCDKRALMGACELSSNIRAHAAGLRDQAARLSDQLARLEI